jgi:hypothetical protein
MSFLPRLRRNYSASATNFVLANTFVRSLVPGRGWIFLHHFRAPQIMQVQNSQQMIAIHYRQ